MDRRGPASGRAVTAAPRPARAAMRRVLALSAAVAVACAASCGPSAPAYPTRARMLDSKTCQRCHADQYRDWASSMHAYASDDPVLQAFVKRGQRETGGKLGSECVQCHAPMAVREGATTDGLNLATLPEPLRGVSCFYCHSVASVEDTHDDLVTLATDLVVRGPFENAVATDGHKSAYSPFHDRDRPESARLCGACHDLRLGDDPIERTYTEWSGSVFSQPVGGATCSQCHMNQSSHDKEVAQAPGAPLRKYHAHDMPALDVSLTSPSDAQKASVQALLDTTIQSAVCVGAGTAGVDVILDAVAAGHDFPSGGAQHRRAWVEVVAYSGAMTIYQSGVVMDGTPIASVSDPDRWELRECLLDSTGAETLMAWQAASYEAFMLPAQVTFDQLDPRYYQSHVYRSFPRAAALPMAPDRVTMRVRVQPIALEIVDALIQSGDLDPMYRARIPTFDTAAVEWTPAAAQPGYVSGGVTYACVSKTSLNFKADKVPAAAPKSCKPK